MNTKEVEKLLEKNALLEKELLKKTVELEQKDREIEIEAVLEKVRTSAMAMHSSDELSESSAIMFQQLKKLHINAIRTNVGIFDDDNDAMEIWLTSVSEDMQAINILDYVNLHIHPVFENIIPAREQKKNYVLTVLTGKEVKHYYQIMSNYQALPQQVFNESEFFYSFFFLQGAVNVISSQPLSEEECNIMIRLAQPFGLIYTRFLDLQKAEAQTREAKIETALERVRARSMAMHKSDEIKDVVTIVIEQLKTLDFNFDLANFNFHTTTKDWSMWLGNSEYAYPDIIHLPYINHPLFNHPIEAVKKGFYIMNDVFTHEEKNAAMEHYYNNTLLKVYDNDERKKYVLESTGLARSMVFLKHINFTLSNFEAIPYSMEQNAIIKRFANVFEQSYTRYLDLQSTETLAREAEIELGLEKVRTKALAMQKSNELADTAAVVFNQLICLGIEPTRLYIGIVKEESGDIEMWATDENSTEVAKKVTFNKDENISIKKLYDGWASKAKSIIVDMRGKELEDYLHYINDVIHIPFKDGLLQKRRVQNIAYFSKGFIGIASPDGQAKEAIQLLERFAAVFNLTFTRFNDLQIAETHALQTAEDLIKL